MNFPETQGVSWNKLFFSEEENFPEKRMKFPETQGVSWNKLFISEEENFPEKRSVLWKDMVMKKYKLLWVVLSG